MSCVEDRVRSNVWPGVARFRSECICIVRTFSYDQGLMSTLTGWRLSPPLKRDAPPRRSTSRRLALLVRESVPWPHSTAKNIRNEYVTASVASSTASAFLSPPCPRAPASAPHLLRTARTASVLRVRSRSHMGPTRIVDATTGESGPHLVADAARSREVR